jgi:uncharacterized protein
MSKENIEIVRAVYEAAARRDRETVYALYDPDVVWDGSGNPLGELIGGASVHHGHEGIRRWFRSWYDAWENIDDQLDELIDAGDEVISLATLRGKGRESGLDVEQPYAAVFTIRDSRIVRVVVLPTSEEALAAVGLAE